MDLVQLAFLIAVANGVDPATARQRLAAATVAAAADPKSVVGRSDMKLPDGSRVVEDVLADGSRRAVGAP